MDARESHILKLALVPEEIALNSVRKKMTEWELYLELKDFTEDKSEVAKDLMQVSTNWATSTACKG